MKTAIEIYQQAIQKVEGLNLPKGRRIVSMLKGHMEMVSPPDAEYDADDLRRDIRKAESNIRSCFQAGGGYFDNDDQPVKILNELFPTS